MNVQSPEIMVEESFEKVSTRPGEGRQEGI